MKMVAMCIHCKPFQYGTFYQVLNVIFIIIFITTNLKPCAFRSEPSSYPKRRSFHSLMGLLHSLSVYMVRFLSAHMAPTVVSVYLSIIITKWSYPCNKPWRPTGLWDVEAPTFCYTHSAQRWRWGCQPYAPASLYPHRKIPGTHFC
jgi:hypothetical protein